MNKATLTLVSAKAHKVLGEYDHSVAIASDSEFAIVYGPNGVGKTKFLEIIHALARVDGAALSLLPFESSQLEYSDGSILSASRQDNEPEDGGTSGDGAHHIRFTLRSPGRHPQHWTYQDDGFAAWIRTHLLYEQISPTHWQDPGDGEIIHVEDLRERYLRAPHGRKRETNGAPKEFLAFAEKAACFLIETQRLWVEQLSSHNPIARYEPRQRQHRRSKIVEQSHQIKQLINEAQTEHSKITQQLDRTFPNRVLSAESTDIPLDANTVRERYDSQNAFRSRLGRIASVALQDELSLPSDDLDDWAVRLLTLYLDDANAKLAPFELLLKKTELLEQIVNSRLLNKTLRITDNDGLLVERVDSEKKIPLDSLSSGEQHEIILMIDLLFKVPAGATVLIDEPEISLHVAWQLAFIPDVQRIAELNGFRFIVATHSPQIINGEWERAVRLGPSEETFE